MERIEVLINKLKDQFDANAAPSQMLLTIQALQTELLQKQMNGSGSHDRSKVAVVLPPSKEFSYSPPTSAQPKHRDETPLVETEYKPEVRPQPVISEETGVVAKPAARQKNSQYNGLFDPLVEIPTLSHQEGIKEVNDLVAVQQESYNDRLRQIRTELGQVLTDSPIKDLRKAIGINDRYVFISELFRGDEAMYERSIKTINSFHIFPEAEYWINRELIVKLGWDDSSNIVKHFYQLVKRRFS